MEILGIELHEQFGTILADPPWQFINKTGKVAPEHRRLRRYTTMTFEEIKRYRSRSSRHRLRIFICGARTRFCLTASR